MTCVHMKRVLTVLLGLLACSSAFAADADVTGLVPTMRLTFDGGSLANTGSGTVKATPEGTATYVTSTCGKALDSSKFTPYGDLSGVFTAGHDAAIAVVATLGAKANGIMIHFKNGDNHSVLLRRGAEAGTVVLTGKKSTTPLITATGVADGDTAYHLYVANILQDRIDLYIDGVFVGTTATTTWSAGLVNFQLGSRHGSALGGESKGGGTIFIAFFLSFITALGQKSSINPFG